MRATPLCCAPNPFTAPLRLYVLKYFLCSVSPTETPEICHGIQPQVRYIDVSVPSIYQPTQYWNTYCVDALTTASEQ